MTVTLNIQNDQELRTYIKEMIKGQVMAIVREEFLNMVKEELERKLKGTTQPNFITMQKEAMRRATENLLLHYHDVKSWDHSFIKPYVEERLDYALRGKDWKMLVDALAKEKVKSLIS